MKKRVSLAIIILLIIIEITFAQASDINKNENLDEKNNNSLKIKRRNISPKDISINFKNVKNIIKSKKLLDIYSLNNDYNQTNPALDIEQNGKILAAYQDTRINDIAWTYLSEDGTYIDGVFFSLAGMINYPAIDYWGSGERFFGTSVPSLNFYNGGVLPIFECSDVTNVDTYNLECVDWRPSGFSQIKDVDIACENSNNKWEFGTISLIVSKESDMNNGPGICYMDPNNSGEIHINWYDEYDSCHHTMCDIDPVDHIAYSVYDCLMTNDQNYKLLLRYDDFGSWVSGEHGIIEISISGIDLRYPAIAINDNNIVILAAAIDDGIKDIICIYSLEGINGDFHTTFVANLTSSENFPQISHIFKNKFMCTFLKNGNYYISKTDDGGKTWKPSRQINDKNGTVIEGYKKTDLCKSANYTLWEGKSGDNIELFFANCLQPVNAPSKPYGPDRYGCTMTCMCCEQYPGYFGGDYSTIGTDPYASRLKYKFYWGNSQGYSDWTEYYEPGVECEPLWMCYYFGGPGTKTIEIRVKAIDENGYESPWSEPLEVVLVWAGGFRKITQSYGKYLNKEVFFIQFISALLPNIR